MKKEVNFAIGFITGRPNVCKIINTYSKYLVEQVQELNFKVNFTIFVLFDLGYQFTTRTDFYGILPEVYKNVTIKYITPEAIDEDKKKIMSKFDLTQAEAVIDMIESNTASSLKMANLGLLGETKKVISDFREKILECLLKIEVNIDYPEYEDIEVITNEKIYPNLLDLKKELQEIIKKSEEGKIINQGIDVGIIGRPNVGKSSLLNSLLEEEKAIVTDIEGTTRDIVEGVINLDGIILNIIDTAGIRETDNIVEKIGVEKSKNIISTCDLIILILNNNEELIETVNREIKEEMGIELNLNYIEPFARKSGYYKDWPEEGKNRKIEIYYYEVKTDEKPNLNNTSYTEHEKEGNFELRYIPLSKVEEELEKNINEYGDKKGIGKEMLELFKVYKG